MDSATLLFYLLFVAGTAWYAQSRGRNPVVWGLVAALISPLIAVILLAFMKDQKVVQQIQTIDTRTQNLSREVSYHKEFNDYRAQTMQQQLNETRQQQLRLQQSTRVPALSKGQTQACGQCGFGIPLGQRLCPNCGEAGTTPTMQTESFQFSLICPIKTHISHIQNLLLQVDDLEQLKDIEYLDVKTGGSLGGTQKQVTYLVTCWIQAGQAQQAVFAAVRKRLATQVDQAGYQVVES